MEVPTGLGVQLGLGDGPINKVVPMSQPRGYHRSRVTHADSYLHTCVHSVANSGQLRVTCFLMLDEQCYTGPAVVYLVLVPNTSEGKYIATRKQYLGRCQTYKTL